MARLCVASSFGIAVFATEFGRLRHIFTGLF